MIETLVRFVAHRPECNKGESKGNRFLFLFIVVTILGCDGAIEVNGKLEPPDAYKNTACEISLWSNGGGLWREEKPYKKRTKEIQGEFDFHWTIGGPKKERWIEIECPGYTVFRTEKFEAPTPERKKDLGVVKLNPKHSKSKENKR